MQIIMWLVNEKMSHILYIHNSRGMETTISVSLKFTSEVSETCSKLKFFSFLIENTKLFGSQMAVRKK